MKFFVLITLMVGAIAPAVFSQSDYLMFASYFDENKARAFDMDTSGNISLREEYTVGKDAQCVSASPNGRLVIVSSWWEPILSCFFISENYKINPPAYNNQYYSGYVIPVAFNPWRKRIYVGWIEFCYMFKLDYLNKNIEYMDIFYDFDTSQTDDIVFSKYSNCIAYERKIYSGTNFSEGVGTVKINTEGHFTTETSKLDLGRVGGNADFTVSPDGRWSVLLGNADPEMSVVGINKNGSLYLVEQWDFPGDEVANMEMVRYTPDGKHLIMMNQGPHILLSFTVDQETGKLTENNWIWAPWTAPQAMAITPDSKFLVVMEIEPVGTQNTLRVLTIDEKGYLKNLEDKYLVIEGFPSDMEFVPPWQETPFPQNGFMLYGQEEISEQ